MAEETCKFPLCKRKIEKDGYCFLHKIYSGSKTAQEKTVNKPIAKVAAKRKVTNKEYKKIVNDMLGCNNKCEIKSPVCTGIANGLNHKQKRSPSNLIDIKNLERSCNACNSFVENNVDWAIENGHQISRFAPKAIAHHDSELNTTIIEPIK